MNCVTNFTKLSLRTMLGTMKNFESLTASIKEEEESRKIFHLDNFKRMRNSNISDSHFKIGMEAITWEHHYKEKNQDNNNRNKYFN